MMGLGGWTGQGPSWALSAAVGRFGAGRWRSAGGVGFGCGLAGPTVCLCGVCSAGSARCGRSRPRAPVPPAAQAASSSSCSNLAGAMGGAREGRRVGWISGLIGSLGSPGGWGKLDSVRPVCRGNASGRCAGVVGRRGCRLPAQNSTERAMNRPSWTQRSILANP